MKKQTLLLHCCCAPCTTSVLERLLIDYNVTLFYYNPCIEPFEEYNKRALEMEKLPNVSNYKSNKTQLEEGGVMLIVKDYDHDDYKPISDRYGNSLNSKTGMNPEGGYRCRECIKLRLSKTAQTAKKEGYKLFTTTLSVSPHKDADFINEIGLQLAKEFNDYKHDNEISYLKADFKKKDGFKRSIELSNKLGLYRQNYCGCKN